MKFHERQEDGTWVEKDEPMLTKTGRVMTEVEIGLRSDLEAALHDLDEARHDLDEALRIGFRAAMGKADWLWDEKMEMHIPCCNHMVIVRDEDEPEPYYRQCHYGPLVGDQIASGDCGEHE